MRTATKYQAFGAHVIELRGRLGLATQAELAQLLGMTQQTVSRWEAGQSRPRADELPKLAGVLKVDAIALAHIAGYAPEAVAVSFDRPLPLASLTPESFEYFALDLLATLYREEADVHPAGKTGHKQDGIDIEARFIDGRVFTFQCKREAQFGAAKVRQAVKAQTFSATKKHILLSRVASPDARKEIQCAQGWDIWDQTDISRIFRTLPKSEQVRIVDIFFPSQRFALTGEMSPGPWLTVAEFFAPQLAEGRIFNQRWGLVGRVKELKHLALALANRDIVAISLIGRAGEGKSRVLRSALESFSAAHPGVLVRVASPTEEICAKSLEDLGAGDKLIVVDDAHDRSDLVQLIRYAADERSNARLLLVYRPYWSEVVQRDLARFGLAGNLIDSVILAKPTKEDAVALASQVLAKHQAPLHPAQAIADLAYDSPLAVVVGAQIVAKEGVHPELFGSNDEFRATVLTHYERMIAEDIASGKDQEHVNSMLRLLALIQPVIPDDQHVLKLLAEIEGINAADASRVARLLIDAGVLFKRGVKYRLSPDLLADSITERACITSNGESNGYAERLFTAALPEHKEHLLLNLGRLDWRRNEGNTSASRLLDGLWGQLRWEDDYPRAQVKAAASAAYFQPRQALGFAERLVAEGHGRDEDVCAIIRDAAYNLEFLSEACALLWEVGQEDGRLTNQHPNHPIRVLTEFATPEPRKPVEFVEQVVDFALSLLDAPESWTGAYTPFDILRGALATEGRFTSAASSREVTITTYAVEGEGVTQVRQRIIAELILSLSHTNMRRAFLAAQLLDDALRGPISGRPGVDHPWDDEFATTLAQLDVQLARAQIAAPVLVRVAESVHWHATYGPEPTRPTAARIIERLDRDLETRTVRAMMDAWGSNTWPIDDHGGRPQHESDMIALCRDLSENFADCEASSSFLVECLDEIGRATGNPDFGPSHRFLGQFLSANLDLARHVVDMELAGRKTLLSSHTGQALGALLTGRRDATLPLIAQMLGGGAPHLQLVAEGYAYAMHPAKYVETDVAALRQIFTSDDGAILRIASNIAREVAQRDKLFAVDLLTSMNVNLALQSSRDVFMWLAHDETIPFDLIREDQLRRLIDGLRDTPRLDDHWINAFLKKALRRVPWMIIDLAKQRIEDAIAGDDWNREALGSALHNREALALLALPEGPALLCNLLDWALGRVNAYRFRYRFAQLIRALCAPYDAACMAIIEGWLTAGGTADHFKVVTVILREAGQRFVYNQEGFIVRALGAARAVGREVQKDLSSALYSSAVSGVRSGVPGKPFDFDLRLKDLAEERLARITRMDPTYELYRGLRDHAARDIEQQIAEGRRMDEEDADA